MSAPTHAGFDLVSGDFAVANSIHVTALRSTSRETTLVFLVGVPDTSEVDMSVPHVLGELFNARPRELQLESF
jgi:hypothetical protein